MNNENKIIDAVKMMRNIRNELFKEYEKDPGKRKRDLKSMRRKQMIRKTEAV